MFLDKKTLLKIWLNLGLNVTIFLGTGPWEQEWVKQRQRVFETTLLRLGPRFFFNHALSGTLISIRCKHHHWFSQYTVLPIIIRTAPCGLFLKYPSNDRSQCRLGLFPASQHCLIQPQSSLVHIELEVPAVTLIMRTPDHRVALELESECWARLSLLNAQSWNRIKHTLL